MTEDRKYIFSFLFLIFTLRESFNYLKLEKDLTVLSILIIYD